MDVNLYKCPNCGGGIKDIKNNLCIYCGSKLIINDGNTINYRFESIDQTKIREEENDEKRFKLKLKVYGLVFLFLIIIEIILICLCFLSDDTSTRIMGMLGAWILFMVIMMVGISFLGFLNNDGKRNKDKERDTGNDSINNYEEASEYGGYGDYNDYDGHGEYSESRNYNEYNGYRGYNGKAGYNQRTEYNQESGYNRNIRFNGEAGYNYRSADDFRNVNPTRTSGNFGANTRTNINIVNKPQEVKRLCQRCNEEMRFNDSGKYCKSCKREINREIIAGAGIGLGILKNMNSLTKSMEKYEKMMDKYEKMMDKKNKK